MNLCTERRRRLQHSALVRRLHVCVCRSPEVLSIHRDPTCHQLLHLLEKLICACQGLALARPFCRPGRLSRETAPAPASPHRCGLWKHCSDIPTRTLAEASQELGDLYAPSALGFHQEGLGPRQDQGMNIPAVKPTII